MGWPYPEGTDEFFHNVQYLKDNLKDTVSGLQFLFAIVIVLQIFTVLAVTAFGMFIWVICKADIVKDSRTTELEVRCGLFWVTL
jgi:hypothetical protein